LEALTKKKAEMIKMGMEMIVKDLASSQAKLEDKYVQDELDVLDVLHHHAVLVAKVPPCLLLCYSISLDIFLICLCLCLQTRETERVKVKAISLRVLGCDIDGC
jgi:hypothetical protein